MPAAKAHALSDASFYVPEIDGLRAVAVGIVMLYHLNFNASVMRGGFVGVDIFFVISGYVVTASLATFRRKNSRPRALVPMAVWPGNCEGERVRA